MASSRRSNKRASACAPAAAAALAMGLGAAGAAAHVLEIDREGNVTVHDQALLRGRSPVAASVVPVSFQAPHRIPLPAAAPISPRRPPPPVAEALQRAAQDVALSPTLLEAVAWAESRFNHEAVSHRGARGVMQLMPGTAADLGVDASDLDANVIGGARYLKRMLDLFDGDLELALAAYNAGPSAVRRYGGVPPYRETRAYVARVMNYLAACA